MRRLRRAIRAFFRELGGDSLDEYRTRRANEAARTHCDEYTEIDDQVGLGAGLDLFGPDFDPSGGGMGWMGGRFGNPTVSYREAHGRDCPTCGGRGWAHMGNPPCPTCGC